MLATPQTLAAGEFARQGEKLTLNICVDIALKKHPQIVAAENALNVFKSRVGQAKSGYYPQVRLNGDISKITSPLRTRAFTEYSSAISLNQNIFDFNRVGNQVDIERLNLESSGADMNAVALNVIFGVKKAYYELLRAMRIRDITAETVKQFEEHLATAKGFFDVGVKPKFDVTKAEVDLSNARLELLRSGNAVRIAELTLNNAIGVPDAPIRNVENDAVYQKYEAEPVESLKKAYTYRPDLKSLLMKREAAQIFFDLAKKDYYPVLSGNAAYGWSGEDFPLQSGWNVGASISLDLFSGYLTRHKIEEARANIEVLRANEEELRQAILLDVEQSYANLREAEKRITTAEIILRQAIENLGLARGRYAAGVGNPLEVTDALVVHANAKTTLSEAIYDHKIAEANMDRAMGVK